jgi:4-carboxymuconolactone decarboxylase
VCELRFSSDERDRLLRGIDSRCGEWELTVPRILLSAAIALFLLGLPAVRAQDRMPPIPPEKYDEAQKKASQDSFSARKVPVFGPFEPLMRSPEVMNVARATGDY